MTRVLGPETADRESDADERYLTDVVDALLAREPHLESDVVFGIRAFNLVEDRLATHLMTCWQAGESSLRRPVS